MEEIEKSTHSKFELWSPVIKSSEGKYIAVLSDNSIDRDDEIVHEKALRKIMDSDGYTAILLNHKNDVLGQIGEWTNKRIEQIDGHTCLVAEPKFYLSNPNAQVIKGCLDEGAQYGISIGAIPKSSEYIERSGKKFKAFTDLELLEASFVAIPANRHGLAMAVAKMYNNDKEEKQMTEELENSKLELEKVSKELTELQKAKEEIEKLHNEETVKNEETLKALREEIEKLKSTPVIKHVDTVKEQNEKIEIKTGELPVIRK